MIHSSLPELNICDSKDLVIWDKIQFHANSCICNV